MTLFGSRRGSRALVLLIALGAVAAVALSNGRASGATAVASATKTVDIAGFAFHPPTLRIHRGGRVAFANSSRTTHTATRGGSFDTGRIKPGTTRVVRFGQRGTFAYHCKIHPFMTGKIVVE